MTVTWLGLDWPTLAAILAMAAITFALRAGGFLVLARIPPTPFVRAFLTHLPGCLFAAFLAPALLAGGWPSVGGAVAAALAMQARRSLPLAMVAGVGTVWLLEQAIAWAR